MTPTNRTARRTGLGWATVLIVLVAFAAGVGVAIFFGGRTTSTDDQHAGSTGSDRGAAPNRVTALGRLQPAGGVIPVYGPPGDRLKTMESLTPGAVLKAGAPIATLASREQREGDVKVAEAKLDEAKAALRAGREAGQKKIDAAQADMNQLLANEKSDLAALDAKTGFVAKQTEAAAKMVGRLEALKAENVRVADEDLEKARLGKAQADAELTAARAAKDKAVTSYTENKKAAEARLAAARAELVESEARVPIKSSEEQLVQARKALDLTVLKAPVDGVVLKVNGHEGQPTGMDPVIQMGQLDQMVAVAEVYESDVERVAGWVKSGPVSAEVTNPALPRPLKGAVRSDQDISRMIARNQVFAVGPREDSDRRVVDVVTHLDPDSSKVAARFVGLQVTVSIGPGK